MGKNKMTRIVALLLAVVCTLTLVAAADLNGDGIINIWDLQRAINDPDADANAVLTEVLGGADELKPNAEGVYEIHSLVGLKNMVKLAKAGCQFKLMKDIDLGGAKWSPVAGFVGHFDGNGKSISNLVIAESKSSNMGLFADISNFADGTASTVSDLHLRNVQVVVDEAARYAGMLVGTNRGQISGCTAIGSVTDARTKLEKTAYIGALVGRNATKTVDGKETKLGTLAGANTLVVDSNMTQQSQWKDTQKVNSKMALVFAQLEEGSAKRNVGVAGFSRSDAIDNSLLWQDISNSTALVDTKVQERRETITDYMYQMCTVKWTPSNTLYYYRYDGRKDFATPEARYFADGVWISDKWYEGGYYRGFPYNHGSSGMDQFLAMMDESNGMYTTKESLPTEAYYVSVASIAKEINDAYQDGLKTTTSGYTVPSTMTEKLLTSTTNQVGYNMYIGADCSSQASWAWRRAIAATGTGSAFLLGTAEMYPTEAMTTKYGYQGVNGLVFETITTDVDGNGKTNDSGDKAMVLTDAFKADNQLFWDALAMTSKGDCLMRYSADGGHTRMAIGDAVVIYKFDSASGSKLDVDKSYIVTAEQGGSGHENYNGVDENGLRWRSTCCVDRKTTFAEMTSKTSSPWFPITCEALHVADTAAAVATCKYADGKVTSNFHIVSTTVNGNTVYTGIAQNNHRVAATTITLSKVHSNIATGDTVKVLLSNGETYTFTY